MRSDDGPGAGVPARPGSSPDAGSGTRDTGAEHGADAVLAEHGADAVLQGRADAAPEDRLLVDPGDYLVDCFRLARKIWEDEYRPDFLVGLWRGGAPPGIVLQEYFRWRGHDPYHTAIRTQSLEGVLYGDGFDIKGFEHVIDVVEADQRLLVVDDLFETGRTIYEVVRYLRRHARRNAPEVRVAVVYYRPALRRFLVGPHYHLHAIEARPVFPDRPTRMTEAEVRRLGGDLYEVLYGSDGDPDDRPGGR